MSTSIRAQHWPDTRYWYRCIPTLFCLFLCDTQPCGLKDCVMLFYLWVIVDIKGIVHDSGERLLKGERLLIIELNSQSNYNTMLLK